MSNKVDQSGFQLDKEELLRDVPFALKAIAGAVIDAINKLDSNHDGHADICQIAPFVIKALPIINALLPLIDHDKLVKWFVSHDFVKDAAAAEAALASALKIAADAAAAVKK